jgi:hypothetical protein
LRKLVARIDPEKAYDFFPADRGWSRQTVNEQVLTPLSQSSIMGTPADRDLIMCLSSFRDQLRRTVNRSAEAKTSTPPTPHSPAGSPEDVGRAPVGLADTNPRR